MPQIICFILSLKIIEPNKITVKGRIYSEKKLEK